MGGSLLCDPAAFAQEAVARPTFVVRKGELVQTLTEKGTVKAKNTTTIFAPVVGEIVWLVEEGGRVKAGDTVARFANEELEDEYEQARLSLVEEEMRLARLKREARLKNRDGDLNIREREGELDLARWRLEVAKKGADETQIKAREIAMKIAQHRLELARLEWETAGVLKRDQIGGAEELRQKDVALREAQVEYNRAKKLHEDAVSGPDRRRIDVASVRVRKAERRVEDAKLGKEEGHRIDERNIEREERSVERMRGRVAQYKTQIESFDVPTPTDGVVVFMNVYKAEGQERSRVQVGETRWQSGDLLQIADMSEILVRVPVSEVDIGQVRVGQEAAIRLLAYPEKAYESEVAEISPFAKDKNVKLGPLAVYRSGYAGVSVVDVLVRFLNADDNVRLGSTAQVSIVTNRLADVLVVPLTAVSSENGADCCWVVDGQSARRRQKVTTGLGNESMAVVEAGLKEGDRIADDVHRFPIRD